MNLNLDMQNILVLKKMYELRNVKSVAEALGKTSGAISKNLTKLRSQLDDPLFIQTKQGFEPTSFVEVNIRHFSSILHSIEAIQPCEFSPANLTDRVRIYAHTHFWNKFGEGVYQALKQAAPNASFSLMRWDALSKEQMLEGESAIAIHIMDASLPQAIFQRPLGQDRCVFFVREDHPAYDLETLRHYPLILLKTPGWNEIRYQTLERLQSLGYEFDTDVEVESPILKLEIMRQSNHFGMTMRDNVTKGFRIIELPQIPDFEVTYVVSCRRSQKDNPLNQWLLETVKEVVRPSFSGKMVV